MTEWMDIASAPKDREVLFGHPDGSLVFGRLNNHGGVDDGDFHDHIDHLTHWREKPAPPKLPEQAA